MKEQELLQEVTQLASSPAFEFLFGKLEDKAVAAWKVAMTVEAREQAFAKLSASRALKGEIKAIIDAPKINAFNRRNIDFKP